MYFVDLYFPKLQWWHISYGLQCCHAPALNPGTFFNFTILRCSIASKSVLADITNSTLTLFVVFVIFVTPVLTLARGTLNDGTFKWICCFQNVRIHATACVALSFRNCHIQELFSHNIQVLFHHHIPELYHQHILELFRWHIRELLRYRIPERYRQSITELRC